jgi:hypothetical protein
MAGKEYDLLMTLLLLEDRSSNNTIANKFINGLRVVAIPTMRTSTSSVAKISVPRSIATSTWKLESIARLAADLPPTYHRLTTDLPPTSRLEFITVSLSMVSTHSTRLFLKITLAGRSKARVVRIGEVRPRKSYRKLAPDTSTSATSE